MQRGPLFEEGISGAMKEGRQYAEMLAAAIAKLAHRQPEDIARRANVCYDAGRRMFAFETLGQPVQIHWPDYALDTSLEMWHHLTVLQYMAEADGTPLTDNWISLREFKEGGLVRGSSFDKENDEVIRRKLGWSDTETLTEAAARLGGEQISGKADLSLRFSFMPRFPLILHLWLADEEFPAACKVLCNGAAEHYLKVEAAGTAAGILLRKLENATADF